MLKRITSVEALEYMPLISGDPLLLQKARAFTLTPDPLDPKWDIVTYYTDGSDPEYTLSPLELMYREWDDIDSEKDLGDEGIS